MYTIGAVTKNKMKVAESYSIDIGIACDTVVDHGCVVKLLSTGILTPVTAVTDKPFGVVTVGNKVAGDKVTVATEFVAITRAQASGTVAIGDFVAAEAYDATTKLQKYKTAVTTNRVKGICLAGNTTGLEITVGVLRANYLI